MRLYIAGAMYLCLGLFVFQGCVDYDTIDIDGGNDCTPNCEGKCCGDDGCGGTCQNNCGSLGAYWACNPNNCKCENACGCSTDEDCPDQWCCVDCMCRAPDCTDLECGPDPVCNISCGECSYGPCVNGGCVGGCTTREDCAGPVCLVCKDYECVPPPPVCQGDHDCCMGYMCNMGTCDPEVPGCISDDECLALNPETPRCMDGRCVPECITDIDCPLPEMLCIDNHCELPPPCTVESCHLGHWCDVSVGECVPGCDEDADCVAPEICNYTTHQCVNVEPSQLGDPCPFDNVNVTAGDCIAGLECLGIPADGSVGTCRGGSPSECNILHEEWNPDCVNSLCGASFCSQECDVCRTCPSGYDAQDIGSPAKCMCVPVMWRGTRDSIAPGDPCPWNAVNAEYDDCHAGLTCLGNDNVGDCPSGYDTECNDIPESYNPDCVNCVCGFSFCVPECDAGGNCDTGFVPIDVSGTCYCIPA